MKGKGPEAGAQNRYRLSTPRLMIETPTAEDAPTLYELAGGKDRSEVTAGLIWDGPDDVSQTLEFVQQSRTEPFDEFGSHWAIRDRTGALTGELGTAIGMIGARPRGEPGRGDVGYWLGRAYWGQGLMSEALSGVFDLCFGELDLVKVEADVFVINTRGIRLVEGLGMRLEGRSARLISRAVRGSTHTSTVYSATNGSPTRRDDSLTSS